LDCRLHQLQKHNGPEAIRSGGSSVRRRSSRHVRSFGTDVILKVRTLFHRPFCFTLLQPGRCSGVGTELCLQLYITLMVCCNLSERISVKPSVLLKRVKESPLSFDYKAHFYRDEKYNIGFFLLMVNTYGLVVKYDLQKPTDMRSPSKRHLTAPLNLPAQTFF
jgi:hypothetical protein